MSTHPPAFNADALVALGRVNAIVPSPDGTWAAVAVARLDTDRARYVSDLWRVSLDDAARAPVRLTRGETNDRAPCFRRDGSLGFLSNRNPREGKPEDGDDERAQVWLLPASGGEPFPITDEPLGVMEFRFAARGDALIVIAGVLPGVPHEKQRAQAEERHKKGPTALRYTEMPVRYWDAWLPAEAPHVIAYDEHGRRRRDLTPGADREHRNASWDVAPDGRAVVISRARTGADRIHDDALLYIDLADETTRVLCEERATSIDGVRFAPNGARVAYIRHQRSSAAHGPQRLVVLDVATGDARELAAGWDRWPMLAGFTSDGTRVLITADDRGLVPVFTIGVASGEVTQITSSAAGGSHEYVSVVPGRDLVVGLRSRITHPHEPFSVALSPSSTPTLLAQLSGFDEAAGSAIATVRSLTTRSSDGEAVQYFLLTPAMHSARGPALPTLVWIHGGPVHQWSDTWHWRWCPLVAVARGFAVALPNPRGSTGFGQAFVEGIWGNRWGDQVYRDVLAVTDAAGADPACDPTRIAAMGGSFGGYMANWIGANTDRYRALVTHAGLFSLSSFHGVTDLPAWWALEMGGAPWAQEAATYDRYSPHRQLAQWKTPTLVVHGERDFRVPISEALALFEGLQAHNVPSELVVFPDENHWILRPRNTVAWYAATLGWVEKWLAVDAGK